MGSVAAGSWAASSASTAVTTRSSSASVVVMMPTLRSGTDGVPAGTHPRFSRVGAIRRARLEIAHLHPQVGAGSCRYRRWDGCTCTTGGSRGRGVAATLPAPGAEWRSADPRWVRRPARRVRVRLRWHSRFALPPRALGIDSSRGFSLPAAVFAIGSGGCAGASRGRSGGPKPSSSIRSSGPCSPRSCRVACPRRGSRPVLAAYTVLFLIVLAESPGPLPDARPCTRARPAWPLACWVRAERP